MKKYIATLSILLSSSVLLYLNWDNIEYLYLKNTKLEKGAIQIIDCSSRNISSLNAILNQPEFKGRPSLVYITPGYRLAKLESDAAELRSVYQEQSKDLNLIYLVYGAMKDKKTEWLQTINTLGLSGNHVLCDNTYDELSSYQKEELNLANNIRTYTLPVALTFNEKGEVTDTIYSSLSNIKIEN